MYFQAITERTSKSYVCTIEISYSVLPGVLHLYTQQIWYVYVHMFRFELPLLEGMYGVGSTCLIILVISSLFIQGGIIFSCSSSPISSVVDPLVLIISAEYEHSQSMKMVLEKLLIL